MRRRDVVGLLLALFLAVVLMVREFLQWEDWFSIIKLGVIILGTFLLMVGLRVGSRPLGMTGLAVVTLVTPFVFRLDDVTAGVEILVFVALVCVPLVLLLEWVNALKAGKRDVSIFRVLLKREMELKRYHFLPITITLGIVMVVMILMSVILSLDFTSRVISGQGYLLWEILLLTGLALIFTVPFIGPFSIKVKQ